MVQNYFKNGLRNYRVIVKNTVRCFMANDVSYVKLLMVTVADVISIINP